MVFETGESARKTTFSSDVKSIPLRKKNEVRLEFG
jgi:hypothetical protein